MDGRTMDKGVSMPETGSGALLTYEKDSRMVTVTITADGTGSLVFLTYQ